MFLNKDMSRLNFHHLHYFWAVAKDGNLTRTAAQLHVSQSALSTQIKQLEEQLGQALFSRQGRTLVLTEAGHVTMNYAETIFSAGQELMALLRDGQKRSKQVLRIGSVATLSRNFQENFVRPLLSHKDVELVLQSAGLDDLLSRLAVHKLDLALSNRPVHSDTENPWRCRRIARQPVSLVGKPRPAGRPFRWPVDLAQHALLLPSRDSDIRSGFDQLCEQTGLSYTILAEVDDMAMLRLLARDTARTAGSIALMPAVVIQDELKSGKLAEYCVVPELFENFYAITVKRHFDPPLLEQLLQQRETDVLGQVLL
jgi:LysR family transcriptional regulator, transcriptional activator of nhaA